MRQIKGIYVCSKCNKVFTNGYAFSGHHNAHRRPPPSPSSSSRASTNARFSYPAPDHKSKGTKPLARAVQPVGSGEGYRARGLLKVKPKAAFQYPNYLPGKNKSKDAVEVSESETTITDPMFSDSCGYDGDSEVSSKSVTSDRDFVDKLLGSGDGDMDLELRLGSGASSSSFSN